MSDHDVVAHARGELCEECYRSIAASRAAADRKLTDLNSAPYTPEQLEELRAKWCNTSTLKIPFGDLILRLLATVDKFQTLFTSEQLRSARLVDEIDDLQRKVESDATESTNGYLCDP